MSNDNDNDDDNDGGDDDRKILICRRVPYGNYLSQVLSISSETGTR